MMTTTTTTNNVEGTATTPPVASSTTSITIMMMTVVPFLLIALSSILLDIVLQHETHFDRCKCQVWMWLALTLTAMSSSVSNEGVGGGGSGGGDDDVNSISTSSSSVTTTKLFLNSGFVVWGHLTIFGNLVVILLEGIRIQQQQQQHHFRHRRRRPLFLWTIMKSHQQFKQIRSFLKSIPIASWTVMVVEALYWVVNNTTMTTKHGSFPPSSSSSLSSSFVSFGGQFYSLQIFLITLVSISLIRWNNHRQEIIQQELQGIPTSDQQPSAATTTTTSRYSSPPSSSGDFCDESVWYTWDCCQVIRWIEQQLQLLSSSSLESFVTSTMAASSTGAIRTSTRYNYDNIFHNTIVTNHDERLDDDFHQEEVDMILSILIPQRITGDVLDGLTVDQLMAMKVPFGPACRLASKIAYRLVEKYPKPLNMTPTTTMASTTINRPTNCQRQDPHDILNKHEDVIPSWLAQHDREYNNNDNSSNYNVDEGRNKGKYRTHIDKSAAAATTTNPYNDNGINFNSDHNQHQQQMEKIMRDRFGLELPKVNTIGLNNTTVTSGDTQKGIERQRNVDNKISPVGQYTAHVEHLRPFNRIQNECDHQPRQPYRDDPTSSPSLTEYTINDDRMNSFPKSVVDQMPPHIQEIVQRRPDLVYQLMQQKEKLQHHRQLQQPEPQYENSTSNTSETNNELSKSDGLKKRSTASTAKGMVLNSSRMTTIAEPSELNNGDNRSQQSHLRHTTKVNGDDEFSINIDSEEDDENEDDGDDERTSLIQQLPKSKYSSSPPLEYYKSIDGCTNDKDRSR